jgi:hypothetical protein
MRQARPFYDVRDVACQEKALKQAPNGFSATRPPVVRHKNQGSRDIADDEVLQKGEPFRDAWDCFGI